MGGKSSLETVKESQRSMQKNGLYRQPFSSFLAPSPKDVSAVPGRHLFTEAVRGLSLDIGLIGQILFHRGWIITHVLDESRNKKSPKKQLQSAGHLDIILS